MASQRFSIDDAREPFDVHVAAKIRVVEEAGRALIVAPGDGPLEALSQACQAIAGASALVGFRSLDETARLVASLATASTPELGEACVEAAEAMRRMLGLEMRHLGPEAWGLALALRGRVGAPFRAPSVDQFSFDDEPRLAADAHSQARTLLFPKRA
jgi:hypothetical protein